MKVDAEGNPLVKLEMEEEAALETFNVSSQQQQLEFVESDHVPGSVEASASQQDGGEMDGTVLGSGLSDLLADKKSEALGQRPTKRIKSEPKTLSGMRFQFNEFFFSLLTSHFQSSTVS
jgi:hypothetical protein